MYFTFTPKPSAGEATTPGVLSRETSTVSQEEESKQLHKRGNIMKREWSSGEKELLRKAEDRGQRMRSEKKHQMIKEKRRNQGEAGGVSHSEVAKYC
jgi:hypothetical protein